MNDVTGTGESDESVQLNCPLRPVFAFLGNSRRGLTVCYKRLRSDLTKASWTGCCPTLGFWLWNATRNEPCRVINSVLLLARMSSMVKRDLVSVRKFLGPTQLNFFCFICSLLLLFVWPLLRQEEWITWAYKRNLEYKGQIKNMK